MRINELLTESEIQYLEEGPKLDAFGRAVGKGVGGLAKGVGAVAGGIAGIGRAVKKGYSAGKAVVGDDPNPNAGLPGYDASADPAASAAGGAAPAASRAPTSAQAINQQGPAGTAPAQQQSGVAAQAIQKSQQATAAAPNQEKANQTVYAQVKSQINNLDKKGKQRILQLLQKSVAAPAPKATTAAAPAAEPAAAPSANPEQDAVDAKNAASGMAPGEIATQRAAREKRVAARPPAEPAAPDIGNVRPGAEEPAAPADAITSPMQVPGTGKRNRTGGRVAGQVSQSPNAVRKRNARAATKSANSAGAGAFGQMANTLQQQNASKENRGNALAEALALRVEVHKQKMFETGLSRGTFSVFKK